MPPKTAAKAAAKPSTSKSADKKPADKKAGDKKGAEKESAGKKGIVEKAEDAEKSRFESYSSKVIDGVWTS